MTVIHLEKVAPTFWRKGVAMSATSIPRLNIESAITTAIEYETRIRDLYAEGARSIEDAVGKGIFAALADDEQRHLDYLNHKLRQWRSEGRIEPEALASSVPPLAAIQREAQKLGARMAVDDRGLKQQMLSKALKLELETSAFYRKMVDELPEDGRRMFARFLEIENNHIEAVQFELDHYGRTGYWMGFEEFDMEAGE
jgi:rubrerythrin